MNKIENTEVLIVGAGPTGLTAANELTRLGIKVKIIDKSAHRSVHSKALGIQAGTLEALGQCFGQDFTETLISAGMKVQNAFVKIHQSKPIEIDLSLIPSVYNFVLVLPQSKTEQFLEERLQSNHIQIVRDTELLSLKQTDEKVIARIKNKDQTESEIHSDFVIGADGAHSVVRHSLGFSFKGEAYEGGFMLGDIKLNWPWSFGSIRAFVTHHGTLAFFPLSQDGDYRVVVVNPTVQMTHQTDLDIKDLESAIESVCPRKIKIINHTWLSRFRVHHRMTNEFQKGRVFLAGDSAHIHSPVGGQGMNTGIQDALNLSSKLALVLKKKAQFKLLNQYEKQRVPVAQQVLRGTHIATKYGLLSNKFFAHILTRVAPIVLNIKFFQKIITKGLSEVSAARKDIEIRKKENNQYNDNE